MNLVPKFGTRAAQNALDAGANIVCGTRYLVKNPDNSFIDSRFPDMGPILPTSDNPDEDFCGDGAIAIGFPTSLQEPNQPSWIIVLCDGETSALADGITMNDDVFNEDWEDLIVSDDSVELETSAQFISATILHEILHFVDPTCESISLSHCALYRTNRRLV